MEIEVKRKKEYSFLKFLTDKEKLSVIIFNMIVDIISVLYLNFIG